MKNSKEKRNNGFVILVAVLVAGIFTVIGASILLISVKELELSAGGTQSQYAFYAADTGMECALYWDLRFNAFASSTQSNERAVMDCAGVDITEQSGWDWLPAYGAGDFKDLGFGPSNSFRGNTIFSIDDLYPLDGTRDDCVEVIVVKDDQSGNNRTYIESRGYNTCDETNPRRVERALRAIY